MRARRAARTQTYKTMEMLEWGFEGVMEMLEWGFEGVLRQTKLMMAESSVEVRAKLGDLAERCGQSERLGRRAVESQGGERCRAVSSEGRRALCGTRVRVGHGRRNGGCSRTPLRGHEHHI